MMNRGIDPESLSLSTHYLRMLPYGSEATMATGTGFIYQKGNILFLITNGHNITRINPETNQRIINSAAFPVIIRTRNRVLPPNIPNSFTSSPFDIKLYKDEDFLEPR